jgi:hypothetical protein
MSTGERKARELFLKPRFSGDNFDGYDVVRGSITMDNPDNVYHVREVVADAPDAKAEELIGSSGMSDKIIIHVTPYIENPQAWVSFEAFEIIKRMVKDAEARGYARAVQMLKAFEEAKK